MAILAAFDPDPLPFIALVLLGFAIGIGGHVYQSKAAVALGILLIFTATVLLPLLLNARDS